MAETRKTRKTTRKNHQDQNHHPQKPPSWSVVRSLFTCKHHQPTAKTEECMQENRKKCKKVGCSGSFCSIRDHTGVVHTQQAPPPGASSIGGGCNSSNRNSKAPLNEINGVGSSSRGMNLRRMSGCIECHTVVDPIIAVPRDASSLRATPACTCPDCSEVFTSNESLELHQAVRHAGTPNSIPLPTHSYNVYIHIRYNDPLLLVASKHLDNPIDQSGPSIRSSIYFMYTSPKIPRLDDSNHQINVLLNGLILLWIGCDCNF